MVEPGGRVRRQAAATGLLIVLAMVVPHKGRRLRASEALAAVVSAGGAVVDIIAITAIAGS